MSLDFSSTGPLSSPEGLKRFSLTNVPLLLLVSLMKNCERGGKKLKKKVNKCVCGENKWGGGGGEGQKGIGDIGKTTKYSRSQTKQKQDEFHEIQHYNN